VSNLCSVFLSPTNPEQEQAESDEKSGGSIRGTLKVTATLDSGATSRDFISSSLAELLVAMGAQEQCTTGTVCLARRGVCTKLHTLLSGIRCIYLNRLTNEYESFLTTPTNSRTHCQTLR